MTLQPVTIALPESFYNQIRRRAEKSLRTVEEELLDGVVSPSSSAATMCLAC